MSMSVHLDMYTCMCFWRCVCVSVCAYVHVCVWVTYNYHGAARQFQSWAAGDYWWVFLCMLMLRTGKKMLHGEKYRVEGEMRRRGSEYLWVCGKAGETRQSEELLLVVLFKSDLVAVWVVTYCRNTVQSLSSSSQPKTLVLWQWSFMLHEKKDKIDSLLS